MSNNLSMEQSFALIAFAAQVESMEPALAKKMLIEFHKIFLETEQNYKRLIAVKWGMESDSN